jgi:hypothetical protein
MTEIESINLSKLLLDRENPRLSEFGITTKSKEAEILQILWDEMAVNELMYSIVSNGFWDYEPLIVMKTADGNSYVAIEGNRRLAAVKLIHDQTEIKVPKHIIDKIDSALIETIH